MFRLAGNNKSLKKRDGVAESDEAKRVLDSFVASFEGETQNQPFVRAADSPGGAAPQRAARGSYLPAGLAQPPLPRSKRRHMDEFLQELKSRDAARALTERTVEVPRIPAVVDDALNYESTNLFVGNLAASVTEEKLRQVFGQYGHIFSVKVMWPRSEDERRRSRNKGFVSFVRYI